MTNNHDDEVKELFQKLKAFSRSLSTTQQDVLTAMISLSRAVRDGTNGGWTESNGDAGTDDAFEPLPRRQIRMILDHQESPAGMVVWGEPVVAKYRQSNRPGPEGPGS